MKHLGIVFTLAAIFVVAATSPASAAPYERRLELAVEDVRNSEVYNDLAEAVVGVRAFTGDGLVETPLPNPAVGKFFGGAWGRGGGFDTIRVGTAGWRLFQLNETVPGVRVDLGNGIFLHAEKGDNGTAFLFLGIASADGGAANLDAVLNKDGKYWDRFCTAVAATPAVQSINSKCADLDKRVGTLEERAGVKAPPAKTKGATDKTPPGAKKGLPWWAILTFAAVVLAVVVLLASKLKREDKEEEVLAAKAAQVVRERAARPVGPAPDDLPANGGPVVPPPPPARPKVEPGEPPPDPGDSQAGPQAGS